MPTRHPALARNASARTAVLAVVALAMIVAGLALFVTRGGTGSGAQSGSAAGGNSAAPSGEEIAFLLDGDDEMAGEGMVIQVADKDDPTRLAAEILADRYDPDGPTIRLVENPKAWLFGDDGAAWLIESDRGRFYIPEGEDQPREGTLTGNVRARRFAPSEPGEAATAADRPDPATDTPALTATTDEPLRFNLDILTFETDGRLAITTDTIDFAGRGAYVVLNESRESITTLRVDQGEKLVYTPPEPEAGPDAGAENESGGQTEEGPNRPTRVAGAEAGETGNGSAGGAAGAGAASTPNAATAGAPPAPAGAGPASARTGPASADAPEPKIDLYRVTFSDNVETVTGPRTITADRLTVWARLLDNKLPDRPAGPGARTETARGTPAPSIESTLIAAALAAQPDGQTGGQPDIEPAGDPDAEPTPIDEPRSIADQLAGGGNEPNNEANGDASDQNGGENPANSPDLAGTNASSSGSASGPADPARVPVVLTWDGPLVVEPLGDSPAELNRGDDLALRYEATDGEVEIVDTDADATANALAATYFAQRERVELAGSGGSIVVASERTGRIEGMNAVEIELAAGVVTIPTAGELFGKDHATHSADPTPQTIAWAESASFLFAVEEGRMTDRLERSAFRGRVRGASKDATVEGETLVALFETPEGGSPRLLQLNVEQSIARDGRGASVGGEGMEVHFASGTFGEEIDPTRAILTGDAFARREGRETIRGQWIDATLARNEDADVTVTLAEARGEVAFDDGMGTAGRGDELFADIVAETATITGPADPDETWVSRDGTRISGPDIRLDGAARTVEVFGPGTFAHRGAGNGAAGAAAPRSIDASWTGRMAFDDIAGTVTCLGDVAAASPGPEGTIDTVTGDRLEITLTPLEGAAGEDGSLAGGGETGESSVGASENAGDGDRLRYAEVFGTVASPARVESTRYAMVAPGADEAAADAAEADAGPADAVLVDPAQADPDAGDDLAGETEADPAGEPAMPRAIESLYRLDAARIRFAAAGNRIEVPTAGRLFVLDRSPEDDEGANDDAGDEGGEAGESGEGGANPLVGGDGSRGSTLITWTGSMDFDRSAGRAVVREDARIVNQPLGEPFPSEVIADTITAALATEADGAAAGSGDLRWAIAEGDALLRIENDREILADRLIYDPEHLRVQAVGVNGNRVEITDLARGTTSNARAVIWDLETDRITITNPGSIVAPE